MRNKREYKNGWYYSKPIVDNRKYEITFYDGVNIWCENIKCNSLSESYEICKTRIDNAA